MAKSKTNSSPSNKKSSPTEETYDDTIKRLMARIDRLENERSQWKEDEESKIQDVEKETSKEVGPFPASATSSSSGTEWKTVKGRAEKEKSAEKATSAQLTWRAADWPLPVLKPSDLKDSAKGVCLSSQKEGESIYAEIKNWREDGSDYSQKKIEGSDGREWEAIFQQVSSRMTKRKCFLTTVGDEPEVRALNEKKSVVDACTLKHSKKTKRVVIHLHARYSFDKDFEGATQAHRAALHVWLRENNLHSDLRFVSQLCFKKLEGNVWT